MEKSDWAAWRMLAFNWGLICAAFALVMAMPRWYAIVVAMILVGGRQLGLGILTHECAHRSFLTSRAIGEWVGNWLCGAPMLVDLAIYRGYHMTHHRNTGTQDDPDLPNYANYPVSRNSLLRKFARDLTGRSGLRALLSLVFLYGHDGAQQTAQGYSYQSGAAMRGARLSLVALLWNLRRILLVNGLMLSTCWALGHAAVYLLWPASWLTTYMLFSRIRNAAEHGALPGTRSDDIWRNTRTVKARWWERLTVAPNFVNFHFEHHLAPVVPSYNLPKLHAWLAQQGAYQRATMEHGYLPVLRRMAGGSRA
ncbi:MAG: fatty acid desaturase family protein [Pseudomonadota bacterium]